MLKTSVSDTGKVVAVSTEHYYLPITDSTPRGQVMILLTEYGCMTIGSLPMEGAIGWFPALKVPAELRQKMASQKPLQATILFPSLNRGKEVFAKMHCNPSDFDFYDIVSRAEYFQDLSQRKHLSIEDILATRTAPNSLINTYIYRWHADKCIPHEGIFQTIWRQYLLSNPDHKFPSSWAEWEQTEHIVKSFLNHALADLMQIMKNEV